MPVISIAGFLRRELKYVDSNSPGNIIRVQHRQQADSLCLGTIGYISEQKSSARVRAENKYLYLRTPLEMFCLLAVDEKFQPNGGGSIHLCISSQCLALARESLIVSVKMSKTYSFRFTKKSVSIITKLFFTVEHHVNIEMVTTLSTQLLDSSRDIEQACLPVAHDSWDSLPFRDDAV